MLKKTGNHGYWGPVLGDVNGTSARIGSERIAFGSPEHFILAAFGENSFDGHEGFPSADEGGGFGLPLDYERVIYEPVSRFS